VRIHSPRAAATKRSLLGAAMFTMVLISSGCGSNTYATRTPPSNIEFEGRVIRDPGLSSAIIITSARIDEQGGAAMAQVTLQNTSSSPRTVEYRFDFFTAQGVSRSPVGTSFRKIILGAGEAQEVRGSAMGDATDFRITIRNAGR